MFMQDRAQVCLSVFLQNTWLSEINSIVKSNRRITIYIGGQPFVRSLVHSFAAVAAVAALAAVAAVAAMAAMAAVAAVAALACEKYAEP